MKALPAAYAWLDDIQGLPRLLVEARALFGVTETPGAASTPQIMAWAKEIGLGKTYPNDGTAWCGLFAAVVAKRAGWDVVAGPLWARNWAHFGRKVEAADAALGDVLVFSREAGGHVGFYVGEDATAFHVLGGNQGDKVSIVRIAKSRCIAVRRPKWRVAEPAGVRKVQLAASGALSRNEA
ncbi:TIGR02594 family protein [Brevundimonas vitis]|uniref:TIGR02594 family protein n=1 Tax=Brevundimonas vitisensis TaxID=2800818 RepID=A0ABX7BRE8_9CAUL|nr:TIGR02594 family protein [Brevundimonas vitisensis]QQQ19847.1 TIGR02594 family protein [Brevundimonas vitisensis]